MVDNHKEGRRAEKKIQVMSISEETETLGDVCRGIVTELIDESRVSEKQSNSAAGTGVPKGKVACSHLPSQLQTSVRPSWGMRE